MMEEDEPRIGGHDFVFVDELSPGQTCSICLLAMRSPVQTVCGHRFCKSCLLETFREGHDQVCPQDRTPIPDGGFFQDVAWERDILSLRVKCKRSDRGCDWTGQLRYYEEHFNLCEYEDVTCGDCYIKMQRRLLHKHTTSECHHRIVQCEYCEEEFEFRQKKYHKDNLCTRFPLDCPQECGVQDIPREEVESHMRDDCAMTMVLCPYEEAGCTFHDKRSQLNDHLEASSEEHLRKTWFKLLRTTERLNELKAVEGQIEELQTDKESMKMLLDGKSEEISDLKMTVKKLEVENMALKKDVAALQKQLEEVKITAADDKAEVRSLKSEYKALKKDVEKLLCSKACPVKRVPRYLESNNAEAGAPNIDVLPVCDLSTSTEIGPSEKVLEERNTPVAVEDDVLLFDNCQTCPKVVRQNWKETKRARGMYSAISPTNPFFPRIASANSQNKGFGYGNNTSYGKHGALSPAFASLTQGDKSLSSNSPPIST